MHRKIILITWLLLCIFPLVTANTTGSIFGIGNANVVTMTAPSFLTQIPNIQIHKRTSDDKVSANGQLPLNLRKKAMQWKQLTNHDLQIESDMTKQEYEYYHNKYQISEYKQLHFCIVVPTFNNNDGQRYWRNIQSIVMQNYTNYRVVVIDDASTDGNAEFISNYLNNQNKIGKERYFVKKNQNRKGALDNIYWAAWNYCNPQDIFMVVDGDDQLIGRQVLRLFNSVLQKQKSWFVYSNFIYGDGYAGYSRQFPPKVIEQNSYRKYPFVSSHLRAFYTKLLRNIKEIDLQDKNGHFFDSANDVAICMPILQQSHNRVSYIPEVSYYYNSATGKNNHLLKKKEQRNNQKAVRQKRVYDPLEVLFD